MQKLNDQVKEERYNMDIIQFKILCIGGGIFIAILGCLILYLGIRL